MNNPPIPPKFSFSLEQVGDRLLASMGIGHLSSTVVVGHGDQECWRYKAEALMWRPIIAAVAEVEWRKRADRLKGLWSRQDVAFYRSPHTSIARMKKLEQEILIATTNADAWREWGSK